MGTDLEEDAVVEEMRRDLRRELVKEEEENNPLRPYCRRVYFVSKTHGIRKRGPKKGKKRLRKVWKEVELVRILPSGRCVMLTDVPRRGLDRLAEEIFDRDALPPNVTPWQHFRDHFRKLEPGK